MIIKILDYFFFGPDNRDTAFIFQDNHIYTGEMHCDIVRKMEPCTKMIIGSIINKNLIIEIVNGYQSINSIIKDIKSIRKHYQKIYIINYERKHIRNI